MRENVVHFGTSVFLHNHDINIVPKFCNYIVKTLDIIGKLSKTTLPTWCTSTYA